VEDGLERAYGKIIKIMRKTLSQLATHLNWIFIITYLASVILARALGGEWWYLLSTLPIAWLIDAKQRNQNWFFVGILPVLGLIILLSLENRKKVNEDKDEPVE